MAGELPQNEFAEKTVLGIALLDKKQAFNILTTLSPEDFYCSNFKNREIFKVMLALQEQDKPIDIVSVTSQLENTKKLEAVGGVDYLVELTNNVTSFNNLDFYIKSLQDLTILRNLLIKIGDIQNFYKSKEIKDIPDFISQCEKQINDITSKRRVGDFEKVSELAKTIGSQIQLAYGSADTITGISCGFPNIDKIINGFNPGSLIILGARASVGKSALALNMSYLAAKKSGKPVAIFSLEMDSKSIMQRLFANRSSTNLKKIMTGFLDKKDRLKIADAVEEMQDVKMYIDSASTTTIDELCLKCRKLKENLGELGLIMIDYIGLINEGGHRFESEQVKIAYFSRRLKQLAGELNCPILCLSQIKRAAEDRDSKKPTMADLRSSGAIEQDADQVLLLYRESYYTSQGISLNKKGKDKDKTEEVKPLNPNDPNKKPVPDTVHVMIAKNRNGETGVSFLYFFKEFGRFDEPANQEDIARLASRSDD